MTPLRALLVASMVFFGCASLAEAQAAPPAASEVITLLPGDWIKVTVWRQEDMTGEFQVDESGVATLPLLGPRKVTGIPMPELRRVLYEEYQKELRNPSVEIMPLRRVYVLGEVITPGIYNVDPTISLAGAIALAGGATEEGDSRRARVIRAGSVVRSGVPSEASLTTVDIRSGDQIFVGKRSWLVRNSDFFVNLLVSASFFAAGILIR